MVNLLFKTGPDVPLSETTLDQFITTIKNKMAMKLHTQLFIVGVMLIPYRFVHKMALPSYIHVVGNMLTVCALCYMCYVLWKYLHVRKNPNLVHVTFKNVDKKYHPLYNTLHNKNPEQQMTLQTLLDAKKS